MTQQDKEQLKIEIDHIFESGANEIRILEMVTNFIDSRSGVTKISSNPMLADDVCSHNWESVAGLVYCTKCHYPKYDYPLLR